MSKNILYQGVLKQLRSARYTWLITGVAGFIGSHLLEELLRNGQRVLGLDNFETGSQKNLDQVRQIVGNKAWENFSFENGDIRDFATCMTACEGVDFVLHEAALGSVALSIEDPMKTHAVNVTGFSNVLEAVRRNDVRRLVFAASSASYGDCEEIPAREDRIGNQMSPYALSKYTNELYAQIYRRVYGTPTVALRYFNVFGPRQDPNGPYAAVIPKWTQLMLAGKPVQVNGDGRSTRDFCYVGNVVQANILAALAEESANGNVFNVATGERTDLLMLYGLLSEILTENGFSPALPPQHGDPLFGEVRHSQADIEKISRILGYQPSEFLRHGLEKAVPWYSQEFS